jgi:hypothetical protein
VLSEPELPFGGLTEALSRRHESAADRRHYHRPSTHGGRCECWVAGLAGEGTSGSAHSGKATAWQSPTAGSLTSDQPSPASASEAVTSPIPEEGLSALNFRCQYYHHADLMVDS